MKKSKWIVSAIWFIVGLCTGVVITYFSLGSIKSGLVKEVREGQHEFINPLLECEDGGILTNRELASFQQGLQKLIAVEIEKKMARGVAVYFRDLNNGPWFGVDEDSQFIPASLFKVPLMIAYLKQAEADPAILSRRIKHVAPLDTIRQVIRPKDMIEVGKSYTVEDLIYRMIVYSDNQAADRLLASDEKQNYYKVFNDLRLAPPDPRSEEISITVKSYAEFYRVLFNASYVNREWSYKALELLSQVQFRGGIVAGVPRDIVVSHKFGERHTQGEQQFHDCGIVYYPNRPYLLCVMSRGAELFNLVSTVQKVSEHVFLEVDRQVRSQGR